jgi:hypothetical protein
VKITTIIKAATAAIALTACSAAPAAAELREPVGGASPINLEQRQATGVSLTAVAGVPHVAWAEDTTQPGQGNNNAIRVARLAADGTKWTTIASDSPITRRATASTSFPSLADIGGVPWVAWSENLDTSKEIRVARLSGSGSEWIRVVDTDHPINHLRTDPGGTADNPVIAGSGGRPYVAFWEVDPGRGSLFFPDSDPAKVWVMRLSADGTAWEPVGGGPVNQDATRDAAMPSLAIVDGRPWVSYFQIAPVDGGVTLQVRVARLADDGAGWTQIGGPVVDTPPGEVEPPVIAAVGGVGTVAFTRNLSQSVSRVYVFRPAAGETSWQPVGDGPVTSSDGKASSASLTAIGDTPWVSWIQPPPPNGGPGGGARQIRVARLVGAAWQQAGPGYAAAGSGGVNDRIQIASVNGFPWVGFSQDDGTVPGGPGTSGCCAQVRVARLEPEFGAPTAFPASSAAALLVKTETYGLPYPIRFEYNAVGSDATSAAAAGITADGAFALAEARPLSPATFYRFGPVATAGTPAPLVRGDRGQFVTPPSSPTGPTGPAGPAGPAATTPLLVAIVRAPARVRRGQTVRLRVLSTVAGTAELTVRRAGLVRDRLTSPVAAGVQTLRWATPRSLTFTRRYRLRVEVRTDEGQVATDAVTVRVLQHRPKR